MRFLIHWGNMGRTFPEDVRDTSRRQLVAWLEAHESDIGALRRTRIHDADLVSNARRLCTLFFTLRWLPQSPRSGTRRTFGPTSAAKVLHLLLPSLCCIWDGRYVRQSLDLDDDAWSYWCYLRALQKLLQELLASVSDVERISESQATVWLQEGHREKCSPDGLVWHLEPILKILDETNYQVAARDRPTFQVRYIRPLVEHVMDGASP